jgi:hypothetical protein
VAIIVDIDGTLADMGERHPFNWTAVGEDKPHQFVIDVVRALFLQGKEGIFMTGRPEMCRDTTRAWLHHYVCLEETEYPFRSECWCRFPLIMRPKGDYSPDEDFKYRAYKEFIEPHHVIEGVIDDRDKVVKMWRERLGLVCIQVAPGNF